MEEGKEAKKRLEQTAANYFRMLLSLSSIVFILEMTLNKNHPSQFSQTIWVSLAEKNQHKDNKHPLSGSGERTWSGMRACRFCLVPNFPINGVVLFISKVFGN